eukprot:1206757-Rhodomonas_salina.3
MRLIKQTRCRSNAALFEMRFLRTTCTTTIILSGAGCKERQKAVVEGRDRVTTERDNLTERSLK